MALITALTTQYGLQVDNAYCRVENIGINKQNEMTFSVCRYVAQGTAYPSFAQTDYVTTYDVQGANVYKQAYAYLTTLDEFRNATCVFEAGQPAD